MPFLWKYIKKLLMISKRPSPEHDLRSAQNCISIEKVSPFASPRAWGAATMTVEAAIVLPLFLFFFVNLGCAIEMIRLHGNLELALWDAGNKVCLYGYVLGDEEESAQGVTAEKDRQWWNGMMGVALSYTWIKSEVVSYAGETYLEESPLTKGASGLQFFESSLPMQGDKVDILMTYQVSPWIQFPAVKPFRMQNRYYGHLWTGYEIALVPEARDGDVVYITEYASVYHERLECTHMRLTIREVTLEEARASRNEGGGRYQECQKCRGALFSGIVFIGKEGDCYHYVRSCPGLKRTIHTIPRQQANGYRPCSRCAR